MVRDQTRQVLALPAAGPDRLLDRVHDQLWDPYFRPRMNVQDVYHYGTEHYDHHRRQLTLK